MARNCGLIMVEKNAQVPLKKIDVNVSVRGTIASLTSEFYYENQEDNPVEAVFVLPLESGISICEFKAEIDGRVVIGRIEEKQEAREIYDDAITSGQTAFLMEESMDSDDIFRISVGNLPPQKSAKVTVNAVMVLKQKEDGELQFLLPTVLNPRYSPASGSSDNWSQIGGQGIACVGDAYTFSLTADIECGSKITDVTSPTHELDVTKEECRAKVDLKNIEKFEKDVEIIVQQEKPFQPFAFVEMGESGVDGFMSSPVVMLNYFPQDVLSESKKTSPGDYIFVIDRSGSMSGGNIKNAREALVLFMKSLPPKSTFNVISFGSRFDKLYPKGSKEYTNENVSHACDIASKMEANYGGTEILRPLESLFSEKSNSKLPRRVFLITDGEVSNTSEVISLVKKECSSKGTRCFALGIGHGASTSLVKGVAKAGNGFAEFAREGKTTQQKVISLLKLASRPYLSDITFKWELPGSPTVRSIPKEINYISAGQPLIAFAEIRGGSFEKEGGEIKVQFSVENTKREETFQVSLEGDESAISKAVHRCAAKVIIMESSVSEYDDSETKNEMIKLSKCSGVLSNVTAFIGVDEDSNEAIKGEMSRRIVPPRRQHRVMYSLGSSAPLLMRCGRGGGGQPQVMSAPTRARWAAPRAMSAPVNCMKSKSKKAKKAVPTKRKEVEEEADEEADEDYSRPKAAASAPHLTLASIQSVDGSWSLTTSVASELGIAVSVLEEKIPSYLKQLSDPKTLWATALVLVLLRSDLFANVRLELELIVEKAADYLDNELNGVISLNELEADAREVIKGRLQPTE